MPLGARQLAQVGDGRNGTPLALLNQERLYAVAARRFGQRWGKDSSDEDEYGMPAAKRDLRLRKFVASREDESEDDDDEAGEASAIRRKWSTAALRNCDMKKERRVQLKTYEEENNDIAGRIQELREEIRNREVLGAERRRYESRGESLFTNKRLHSPFLQFFYFHHYQRYLFLHCQLPHLHCVLLTSEEVESMVVYSIRKNQLASPEMCGSWFIYDCQS
jgi:hypothetical protein